VNVDPIFRLTRDTEQAAREKILVSNIFDISCASGSRQFNHLTVVRIWRRQSI
jgi:hypothetical protein